MKTSLNKLPKSQVELEVEFSAEEFDGFFEKAFLAINSNLEIKGFRKGKVPREKAIETIGQQNIVAEAADLAVRKGYEDVMKENKLEIISSPEVEVLKVSKGNPFIFKIKANLLPEIKMPDYKKIASGEKRKKIEVEEKEVEDALLWLQKSRAKFSLKQGPSQKGDFVELEYTISQDGKNIDETPKADAFVLGEGHFIPGFEDHLIGMSAGEEKDKISLKIPQDHIFEDLKGKEISIKVKVKSVQKVELPELTDEFVKSLGKFESLVALKENVRSGILSEKEHEEYHRIKDEVMDKIIKEVEADIPDFLVEEEKKGFLARMKEDVKNNLGITFEEYLLRTKKTEKELMDSFSALAEKKIKSFLSVKEIAKLEKLELEEKEVEEEAAKILKKYQSAEDAQKNIDPQRLKDYTREVMTTEKVFNFLENLTVNL
jgi:trigger factor